MGTVDNTTATPSPATLGALLDLVPSPDERAVLHALSDSVWHIAQLLRDSGTDAAAPTSDTNAFGDTQLAIDVKADDLLRDALSATGVVASVSSEETPGPTLLNDEKGELTVVYDPLDGSSILPTNFAVGTIAAVWRARTPLHVTGHAAVASLAAMYGPRTTILLTVPSIGRVVYEATLPPQLHSLRDSCVRKLPPLREGRLFAPANLRATADNEGYARLVQHYIGNRYTLRYTGGMVPDVTQILLKGYGVFVSPVSPAAPAKLRLLYEAIPMAHLVEAAGGASSDGSVSLLSREVKHVEERTPVCVGTVEEVKRFEQFCHKS